MKIFKRKQKEIKRATKEKSPLVKSKIKPILPLIIFTLMFYTQTVFANSNSDFTSITTGINNLGDTIKGLGLPICTVAVIVSGIMMMCGQRAREIAKYTILSAGGGLIIVNFADPIANMINSF